MIPKIKLCGLSREEDILQANALKPDFIGFVFFKKSIRNVSEEQAAALKEKLDKAIKSVGVFVDADIEFIERLHSQGTIDIAQLHGHEDEDYIAQIKPKGITTIKAFKVRSKEDLDKAAKSGADYILLDAGMGEGKSFDWELLKSFDRPYFLAGGLDTENVESAVNMLHPFGVDVSSGIETGQKKDPDKMKLFVENIRKAEEK